MNLGLVTSTVIGGMLLLGILTLNIRMSQESDYTTMNQITKMNVNAVANFVEYDFRKVGYNAPDPKIEYADSTKFTFNADLDDDGSVDQVTWEYKAGTGVSSTNNPDDRLLVRIKNGQQTDITRGVTDFDITYYDDQNQTTTNPPDVIFIEVFIEVQSPSQIDGEYITTSWEKRFAPWNLQQ
jgi:hypothetical protein